MRKSSRLSGLAGLVAAAAIAAASTAQFGATLSNNVKPRGPTPPSPYYGGRKHKAQWKRERGMR